MKTYYKLNLKGYNETLSYNFGSGKFDRLVNQIEDEHYLTEDKEYAYSLADRLNENEEYKDMVSVSIEFGEENEE